MGIRCCTPCLGKEQEKVGVVNAGRLRRRDENLFDDVSEVMRNDWCGEREPLIIFKLSVRMRRSLARSTRRLCEWRKSPPKMGCVTSATMKPQVYFCSPNCSTIWRVPNDFMGVPFAAMSGWLFDVVAFTSPGGKMLSSEPVSTRKYFLELASKTWRRKLLAPNDK